MKNLPILLLSGLVLVSLGIFAGYKGKSEVTVQYEWKQLTVIESVVAAGLGRSRLITTDDTGKLQEEKLSNLYSAAGINFGNVKDNDLKITTHISGLTNEGWELYDVTSGVHAYGRDNSDGIFMTRYLLRKEK